MLHSVAQDLAKLNWTCDSCGMSVGEKLLLIDTLKTLIFMVEMDVPCHMEQIEVVPKTEQGLFDGHLKLGHPTIMAPAT